MPTDRVPVAKRADRAGPIEEAAIRGFGFTLGALLALAVAALTGFVLYEGFMRVTGARGAQRVIEDRATPGRNAGG